MKKERNQISKEKVVIKATRKDYFKLVLILFGIIAFFACLMKYLSDQRADEIRFINKDYTITKGIITKISLHKGKHVRIKYLVDDKVYIESDGMQKKLNKQAGDSISIKYSNKKPELMISEYNLDY
ncbi:hypothetical protein [Flavobacterium sp.]|uniref:hypothetical protein n=1 Tax=Flavobacterium sp. TaxID=239 RepID=UPI002ED7BE37